MSRVRCQRTVASDGWIAGLLLALVALGLAQPAEAAVTVTGTPASNKCDTACAPLTIASYTTPSDATLMLVGVSIVSGVAGNPTSVTYNGTGLTPVCSVTNGVDQGVAIYKYENPPAVTADVVVNFSPSKKAVAGVVTFTGVKPATMLGTCVAESDLSVTVSSETGGLVFDAAGAKDVDITADASQAVQWDVLTTGGVDNTNGGGSTKAGAASVTMTWTGAAAEHCMAAVPIKPSTGSPPTAPTTPYSNDNTAQSGLTNPTGITDSTPAFSAIFQDPDSGNTGAKYRVEVNTASDFTGTVKWDSGASGTTMTATAIGARSPNITYDGSALASNTTYYWRITFWDDANNTGAVSATQSFATGTLDVKLNLEGTGLQLEGTSLQVQGGA